ncbi:helix-turn-helix transcriptional regulator [Halobacteriales archaeon Cl-PHB]
MTEPSEPPPEFATEVVKRAPILAELDGPEDMTLRELDAAVSLSRSTIHRTLERFAERGLVENSDGEYVLTNYGRTVAAEATAFTTRLDTARRLDELLNVLGPSDVEVPLECFADARVVTPGPRRAHQGIKRSLDLFERADSVRILSGILSSLYVDGAVTAMDQGTDIEVVFDEDVVEVIPSEYDDQARQAFETGHFTVYSHEAVPFELFVSDDRIGIAAHDDRGLPRMYVESDDPEAVGWAEELYHRYREAARVVDPARLL